MASPNHHSGGIRATGANSTAVATRSDEAYLQRTDTITQGHHWHRGGGNFEALTTTPARSLPVSSMMLIPSRDAERQRR
ncbi:MAG: hypothetical protein IPO38_08510 [Rhodocyclaceae bacterium]|nr:hypothetical protein [Rhodocyclaceae bacterium]